MLILEKHAQENGLNTISYFWQLVLWEGILSLSEDLKEPYSHISPVTASRSQQDASSR